MTILPNIASCNSGHVLKVERPYYEQEQLNDELHYSQSGSRTECNFCSYVKSIRPKKLFLSIFPIFSWLPKYNVRSDLAGDVVSGCTVAIMHIPQGESDSALNTLMKILIVD